MNQLVFNASILFKRWNFTLDSQPEPAFLSFSFLLILLTECQAEATVVLPQNQSFANLKI